MPASALPPFEVSCVETPEHVRLALRGELDMSSAPMLTRELQEVEAHEPREILLDLTELSFMDVTGLRTILDAARRARRAGRAIVIANPLPHILRLLELTAIDQTLEVLGRPLAPVR
jgi:anti-anti-sigma factor